MRELIARLIDCGFQRDMAVAVACIYRDRHGIYELERYVESVEEECRYKEEEE